MVVGFVNAIMAFTTCIPAQASQAGLVSVGEVFLIFLSCGVGWLFKNVPWDQALLVLILASTLAFLGVNRGGLMIIRQMTATQAPGKLCVQPALRSFSYPCALFRVPQSRGQMLMRRTRRA